MAYTLPDLPYPENALEPHIDAQTMNIHRTKHHQAYINNVNAALEKHPNLANKPIDQLMRELSSVPEDIRTAVRNNGGGHANHSLFWTILGPKRAAIRRAIWPRPSPALRQRGHLPRAVRQGGDDALRQRLGLAVGRQGQARRRELAQSGHAALRRSHADSGARRLGARILPEIPKPPARLHHRVLERGELGRSGKRFAAAK